jgi:HEAT repeat protein
MRTVHGQTVFRSSLAAILLLTSGATLWAEAGAVSKPDTSKQAEEEKHKAEMEAEKAAREKITEFNKAIGAAKSSADIANAIRLLDVKHPLIFDRLIQMLNGPGDEAVFTAVVDALVKLGDPRCVPVLNSTLLTKLGKVKDNAGICVVLLKALGQFADRNGAPAVAKALDCNEVAVATEACTVSAKLKDPLVIDELIKLLKEAEQADAPYVRGGNRAGGGGNRNATIVENPKKALREPAKNALQSATGKSFASGREWQTWWSANRSSWRPAA